MIKYIKLDWFKLVQGIMDAIVLEEEPKQHDVYVEVFNCDEQAATVDEFMRKSVCWKSSAFDTYLKIAIYYKLTKKKTIFDYRVPDSSHK